jgi:hypothetical protein
MRHGSDGLGRTHAQGEFSVIGSHGATRARRV